MKKSERPYIAITEASRLTLQASLEISTMTPTVDWSSTMRSCNSYAPKLRHIRLARASIQCRPLQALPNETYSIPHVFVHAANAQFSQGG